MRALVRGIAASFVDALCATPARIEVTTARAQHAAYVAALRAAGVDVIELPADERFPDGCFVEDCAVVAGGVALITRPGAPSRRGEEEAVGAALATAGLRVERMAAPATLDGGDVLQLGGRIFVGRSARTNAAGVARLREVFADREVVEVHADAMHLKCLCSPLGDDRVLAAPGTPDFGVPVVPVPGKEAYAANAVAIDRTVVASAGFPRTHAALAAAGFRVVPVPTTEARKADGALTCLSVLFA